MEKQTTNIGRLPKRSMNPTVRKLIKQRKTAQMGVNSHEKTEKTAQGRRLKHWSSLVSHKTHYDLKLVWECSEASDTFKDFLTNIVVEYAANPEPKVRLREFIERNPNAFIVNKLDSARISVQVPSRAKDVIRKMCHRHYWDRTELMVSIFTAAAQDERFLVLTTKKYL